MTEQNRPRHSFDDHDDFDDLDAPIETSGDAAGAGGAVGAEARSGQGLPLRGIAMILIAVAIALIAWGLVSFFADRGDGSGGGGGVHSSQDTGSNLSPAEQARLAKEKAAAERDAAAKASERKGSEQENKDTEKQNAEKKAAEKAEAEKKAAAPAPVEVNREATHVTVLNNSPIDGLAGRTAGELRGEKWDATSVGNLPDTAYVFRQSVVLYPAGDEQAKAAAEQIGAEYKISTRERSKEIDDSLRDATMLEGPAAGAVIVVTVNDLPH